MWLQRLKRRPEIQMISLNLRDSYALCNGPTRYSD